ncbi:hypothetical protein [uncultured Marinobacter sp.]|uniref:hypothetical protein n=1 Tax=uncultured Marinobacter sp. TaxID=187379 RepID=UPI0025E75C80|nr:hypothetical protein [uncultured Marinobacter sp.]
MRRLPLIFLLMIFVFPAHVLAAPKLTITNGASTLVLDRNELESFPQTTFSTISPYFDGEVQFSGPTLARVLETFGVSGQSQITLTALNNYNVSGSLEDLLSLDAIIATRRESKTMSVRDRGPFWVILPLSERPELDNEDFHRYMVWQLSGIELE